MRGWNFTARLKPVIGLLALLCLAQPVGALEAPVSVSLLRIGQRVRVEYDTTVTKHILFLIPYSEKKKLKTIGEFRSWDSDSLVLALGFPNGELRSVPSYRVDKVFVSEGKRRAILKGAGTGALLMSLMALAPGIHSGNDTGNTQQPEVWRRFAAIGVAATVGGVIGWFVKVDRWKEVEKRDWPFQLKLTSRDDGLGLGLTYNF